MMATALQQIDVVSPCRKWPKYSDYKPTGLPWLAKAPAHWSAKRLRYVVRFPTKGEIRGLPLDTSVSFVPMEAVGEYGGLTLDQTRQIEDMLNGYTYFRNADVLVAKITPCFENGKGALADGLENGIGFGTTELHVLRAGSELLPRYLLYLTFGEHFRKLGEAEMYGAGGQKRVPEGFIQNLRHPLPPLDEQRAIAAFLDRETARIDELITEKFRLLQIIDQRRVALISKAATCGLTGAMATKPSGIDWLGDIPDTWTALPLKRLAKINYGLVLELDRTLQTGTPIISLPNVTKEGHLVLDDVCLADLTSDEKQRYTLKEGDLLFNWRNGSPDHVGKTAYVHVGNTFAHVSFLLRLRFDRSRYEPRFFQHVLNNLRNTGFFGASKNQVNKTYNQSELGQLRVMVPPVEEQRRIADYMERVIASDVALTNRTLKGVNLLRTYRSALIAAAVTGQIDVRQEAN